MNVTYETQLASEKDIERKAERRRKQILALLEELGPLTASEAAHILHERGLTSSPERNYAAPRLTELKNSGRVMAVAKKPCPWTGKTVALWEIVPNNFKGEANEA